MHSDVQDYYGNVLQNSEDLQTNACCTSSEPPDYLKKVFSQIHDDVLTRYYGCGLVIPEKLDGLTVLDLGCGAGRDVYTLSALVGENGKVIGVDMTQAQLDVAKKYQSYHQEQFGHNQINTAFHLGTLEDLDKLDIEPGSVDVVVSNCVINLCLDKEKVLKHVAKLLKPGGEMYFSDVYSDRRIPAHLQEDPVLYGECLSGAFYWHDFLDAAKSAGFADPRLVTDSPITVENAVLQEKLGACQFYSATYRLFKLDGLETACQDYGQAVIYKGGIPHHEHAFTLDAHHIIETGKVFPVCGNTYRILADTRFQSHFEFIGSWDTHYGIFDGCGTPIPYSQAESTDAPCC